MMPSKKNGWAQKILRVVEPLLYRRRAVTLTVLILVTLFLATQAALLRPDAGWLKMVPQNHPYMQIFKKYYQDFGGANTVLVDVENHKGDIYQPKFMETLQKVTNDVFFVPGVDRARVTSIFTPNIIYTEVVEGGLSGETVVPSDYTPTPAMMQRIRSNVSKANVIGRLVSEDQKSALVVAELLDNDPVTNKPLDYAKIGERLEAIRHKYETPDISVRIIGFAKVVDDMTRASFEVGGFFVIALVLMGLLLWAYIGSLTLAALVVGTSLVSCIWELGLLHLVGYGLDPFAMLVPFLIMAVSVSHAVQYVNSWGHEIATRGVDNYHASLATFRALAIPGVVALLTNVAGFSTIYIIDIQVIREMAINAAFGMIGVIVVNKALLPVLLSYLRIPNVEKFRQAQLKRERLGDVIFKKMAVLTHRGPATVVIAVCILLSIGAATQYSKVQIGDTTAGVPELRPNSRFNQDARAIAANFSLGVDQLRVIAEMYPNACIDYTSMQEVDRFNWYMRNLPQVRSVLSLQDLAKLAYSGLNEGRLNAEVLPRNSQALAQSTALVPTTTGFLNDDCSALSLVIFTRDHKAQTITALIDAVKKYEATMRHDTRVHFRLASGNIGVMAATNEVVAHNDVRIVVWVYAVILLFLWLSFRTLSGVLCVALPLAMVTLMGYAVMVFLGIGQKVATLPVLAFACGVGVDYGIYSYSVIAAGLRRGLSLEEAYYQKMRSTGKATLFTGVGLATGVAMWMFSELQFQRDMGVLLVFGFTANMIGAIVVLPALAHFLSKEELKHAGSDLMAGADEALEKGEKK
ncbi:MAG TPA: MMPL family transporter [Stenotrophobium sp.]|jgi:predicted RND superfamily exporter protein|nr:MMPL family transporter [Stenotrophobium sp.]